MDSVKQSIEMVPKETSKRINQLMKKVLVKDEPYSLGIPYPQADNMDVIKGFVEHVDAGYSRTGYLDKESLGKLYNYTPRQIDYYANTAKYLRLIKVVRGNYLVTSIGKRLASTEAPAKKNEIMIQTMLSSRSIRRVFELAGEGPLTVNTVLESFEDTGINMVSETTSHRRAQTVLCWVRWALQEFE